MKKYLSIFSFFFFLLFASYALAGSTTLTTFYPPPTAAYNQVKLATNVAGNTSTTLFASYCTGSNPGAIFLNNATSVLYQCPIGVIIPTPNPPTYCSTANPGTIIADYTGALHVCMTVNGVLTDTIYPQNCYNAFCSYTSPASSCGPPTCANGFTLLPAVDANSDPFDLLQISSMVYIRSYVCCTTSPPPGGTASYPPGFSP